jgi:pimeloyl-ACP methyl ester carboxylesterase
MKPSGIILGVLTLMVALASCSLGLTEGNLFFLRSERADLPVWVYGNTASNTFIVFLHGGPGDNALKMFQLPAMEQLQKRYGIVLWDQRLSGNSQGNASAESFTMDQAIADTKAVITLVKRNYGAKRIFLMGASWGGCLGTAYLLDPARQTEIAGWIEVDGYHNGRLGNQQSRLWALDKITQQLALPGLSTDKVQKLNTIRSFYLAHPVLGDAEVLEHSRNVNDLGGYQFDPEVMNRLLATKGFDLLFFSPENLLTEIFNAGNLHDNLKQPIYQGKTLMQIDRKRSIHRVGQQFPQGRLVGRQG